MDNLNKLHATHHEGLQMKSTLVAEQKTPTRSEMITRRDTIHVSNNDRKSTRHAYLNLKRRERGCEPQTATISALYPVAPF